MIQILDAYTDRATYLPGDRAAIQTVLRNDARRIVRGILRARLLMLDAELARVEAPLELAPRARAATALSLTLPPDDLRGYGIEIEFADSRGRVRARAATALDVCADWTRAPRYGFLSDFACDENDSHERVAALARYHINAIQFYDWMYRHQEFLPPTREFVDPLGRRLSLDTVQRKIQLAQQLGMRALAYAAIYAANRDFFTEHREEGLYRSDGQPFMLGDFLNITNIAHPAWRARLLAECRRAVDELGFDGIHLDQYGYPRIGYSLDGARVDVEKELPAFLSAVRAAVGNAPTVFNAVNAWPLAAVAQSTLEPLYVEVWPPNDTFRDLREIILRARDLRSGRAPVLAAYLRDFQSADPAVQRGAMNALRRLTAAIYLNGGSHIVLGERDGVLCAPYFPDYARLRPAWVRAVRADYDFIARYAEYFFDPTWRDNSATSVGGINEEFRLDMPRYGPNAEANSVWTIARAKEHTLTLGLVNLRGMEAPLWNAPQPAARRIRALRVTLQLEKPIQAVYFASPDYDTGRAVPLPIQRAGRLARVTIPELAYWGLVIVQLQNA